jgi:hypothetical protein
VTTWNLTKYIAYLFKIRFIILRYKPKFSLQYLQPKFCNTGNILGR